MDHGGLFRRVWGGKYWVQDLPRSFPEGAEQPEKSISRRIFRSAAWALENNVAYGTLTHVDDAMKFFSLEFTARVLLDQLTLASSATEEMLLNAVRIFGGKDDLHSTTISDKTEIDGLEFEVMYGAENAVARSKTFTFDRNDIAARILARHEEPIRERAMATVGVWRADVVEQIRASLPVENELS